MGTRIALCCAMDSTADAKPAHRATGRRWQAVASAAASAVIVAVLLGTIGPSSIASTLRHADTGWLAAGVALSALANALASVRWLLLVRWLGHRLRWGWVLAVHFKSTAINAVLPGALVGGDVYRAWRLHNDGCAMRLAGLSVFFDRLSGLLSLVVIGAIALLVGQGRAGFERLPDSLRFATAAPVTVAAATLLLAVAALLPLMAIGWRRRRGEGVGSAAAGRAGALEYGRQVFIGVMVQALYAASMACAARAFGVAEPLWLLAVTTVPIFLVAALPVSFGGWGTREAAAVAVWGVFGVAPPVAFSASLSYGLFGIASALLGTVCWRFESPPAARR